MRITQILHKLNTNSICSYNQIRHPNGSITCFSRMLSGGKSRGAGRCSRALPKYQHQAGHIAKVVMPMYQTKFLNTHEWDVVHKGYTNLGNWWFIYTIIKERHNTLGFDLYLVDINGLLDREKIYGYDDDPANDSFPFRSPWLTGCCLEPSPGCRPCSRPSGRPDPLHDQA